MIAKLAARGADRQRASISAVVTRGSAAEVAFVFSARRAVGPFSVGSNGDWRVVAAGVAPVHLYLCFDGDSLFATAGGSGAVTLVGGEPLDGTWRTLPDACELHFGAATVAIVRSDARGPRIADPFSAETLARPIPSLIASAERRIEDPFEAATVLRRPYEARPSRRVVERPVFDPLAAETIAAPSPMGPEPAHVGIEEPSPFAAERVSATPAPVPTRAPAPVAQPRTPLVRKVIAGLMVAAVLAVGFRALEMRRAKGSAEPAAVAASSRPGASAAPKTPTARVARPARSPERLAPLPFENGRTPERQAVDRVARGAYAEAAVLYENLARRTDDPTFALAARIARRKAQIPFTP